MEVGEVLKPQGIRGEIKVRPLTDDPSRFRVLKSVYLCGLPRKVESVRIAADAVFIKLEGINSRDDAERLRGCFISIDRAAAVPLSDGEYFIAELIGAALYTEFGDDISRVGVITDIQSYGAADVFSVETDDKKHVDFSFVKALCPRYDSEKNCLTVDKTVFDGVAVYNED